MVKAARRAGRSLKRDLGEIENLQVSLKGPANFVTLADRRAEEMLHGDLTKARPGYGFIGEEGGSRVGEDKTHTWIVDPLDGTTNFLHGIPQFAISIGLERQGKLVAAVVYHPIADELFTAERGMGARLNGRPLQVTTCATLVDSLLCTGFPYSIREERRRQVDVFAAFLGEAQAVRRLGSAALDLCYVAAGRFDGFWEERIHPWDIAAGAIIIEEAGGMVTGMSGERFDPFAGHIAASNGPLHASILAVIRDARRHALN
jgi:myo-inositol-1(or 4)-monophosphatase